MDLHYYPCPQLIANKIFAISAAFAHNLVRFIAFKDIPERPQFAKAIRMKYIDVPCQTVRHAKDITFLFMKSHFAEVMMMLMRICKMGPLPKLSAV
jgi:hypothetical protein